MIEAPDRDRILPLLEAGLAAVVVLGPLPFGAVRPPGRDALELLCFGLLALWGVRAWLVGGALPPKAVWVPAMGLLLLAAAQAVPLGEPLVRALSPASDSIRARLVAPSAVWESERARLALEPAEVSPRSTFSLSPGSSIDALRTGVALTALLLVAATIGRHGRGRIVAQAGLLSAAFQSVYGLLVVASASPRIWNEPKIHYLDSATGTFVNRNHFACYQAMMLCVGLGFLVRELRRSRRRERDRARVWFWGFVFLVGLAGVPASLSRTGIALGGLALLGTWACAVGISGLRARLAVAVAVGLFVSLPLIQLGPNRLFERYVRAAGDLAASGGRLRVWQDTVEIVTSFPLLGCGFGTFAEVYPAFRSPDVRRFYAHAHNDVLQTVAEGGAIGALLAALLVGALGRRIVRGLTGLAGAYGVGLAAALACIALHSLVDFNLHIPANAAAAAVLAGLLVGRPWRRRAYE